jgi:GNAT superfamily N-acetyltransferase
MCADTTVGIVQSDDELLARRVHGTLGGYYALGNEVIEEPDARFIRNRGLPRVYDANLIDQVRVRSDEGIDAVLQRADEIFTHCTHRHIVLDPTVSAAFEARLVMDGYVLHAQMQLLLKGELQIDDPDDRLSAVEIRSVESEDDWQVLESLTRLDHEEEAALGRQELRPEWLTTQMVEMRRAKAPHLQFFLAALDGADCGFFSSWPGDNGVAKVEDLFTHPDFRHRGVATALIRHCVSDARARGAEYALIGALIADTPKQMYADLGFRPYCVARRYLKTTA